MPEPKTESYNDLVFKLGDLARERLANRPSPPRSLDRVLKAEETLLAREDELKAIEAAMDEEETAYNEFREAVEAEKAELADLAEKYKKTIAVAESKYKAAREKIASKENDLKHAKISVQKEDTKLKSFEELGEKSKAEASRASIKHARMDVMRRTREINEMVEVAEKIWTPEDDSPGSQAVRAKARLNDLEKQLEERVELYNSSLAELDQQAAEKEQEIHGAREYHDQAIFLLGEEVHQQRISDPALVPMYLRLDKAR
jgi:chromosome segregation ATPase